MLLCTYARARWSDLRFIHHVEIESKRNGCLVLYTTEHKTSAVGEKKEQYLPFVVPWDGVTNENWLQIFLDLYQQVGLNIHKVLSYQHPDPVVDSAHGPWPHLKLLPGCEVF
ncbi:unnamed protein product [Durusdinium trenchii]|uniref:Uncharacterized protein n=1 Tax=Durusdinium trenchii TaxID=1381693 RepID=A0ABP0JMH4_9DINO